MTLQKLEQAIKKYVPDIWFRQAGYGDIVGVYKGSDYLFRLSKGDVPLYTWRAEVKKSDYQRYAEATGRQTYQGQKKRGRMQALQLLVTMRFLSSRQAQQIMCGVYD